MKPSNHMFISYDQQLLGRFLCLYIYTHNLNHRVSFLESKSLHQSTRIHIHMEDMSSLFVYFCWGRPSFPTTSPGLLSRFSRQIAVVEGTGHVLRQAFAEALGFLPVRQVWRCGGSLDQRHIDYMLGPYHLLYTQKIRTYISI